MRGGGPSASRCPGSWSTGACPSAPNYVALEQLEDQAKSIRPAVKHVKAMEHRDELDAEGRIKSLEAVRDEFVERQAAVDAEIDLLEGTNAAPFDGRLGAPQ